MGRKVNPVGFRLGIVSEWESKWYAERNYTDQLHEDIKIRRLVMRELTRAGISKIELERSANKVDVTLHTSKPGIVIGKQGANVERIRQLLEKSIGKKVHLKIEEIKVPETDARLIAESIAEQIARRVAYRRAMKHSVQQAIRRGAKGVKIRLSGRLGGAEMSRTVVEMDGRVPLHTIRADIDYAVVHAHTTYGRIGVKVWVYNGDVIPERGPVTEATLTADLAAAPADYRFASADLETSEFRRASRC
jgi:small subunit ribosomal protein S3